MPLGLRDLRERRLIRMAAGSTPDTAAMPGSDTRTTILPKSQPRVAAAKNGVNLPGQAAASIAAC